MKNNSVFALVMHKGRIVKELAARRRAIELVGEIQ